MSRKKLYQQSSIILFVINILFWFGIFVYFTFIKFANEEAYLILKMLILGEPIIFCIGLIGYLKRHKVLYILMLPFLIGNAILSITDEIGIFDLISLVLNLLLFIVLVLQWKNLMD